MRYNIKDFPLTVQEIRGLVKKEDSKKYVFIGIALGVLATLIAIVLWVAKQKNKDLKEHYEYVDGAFNDDEQYGEFDEDIYTDDFDESESVGYVSIKDFINESNEAVQTEEAKTEESTTEGLVEESSEEK